MSPTKAYAYKMRAVIAVLALALFSCIGMIYYLSEMVADIREASTEINTAKDIEQDTRSVLVAKGRVETGRRLSPEFFAVKAMQASHVSEGMIMEADLPRVSTMYSSGFISPGSPVFENQLTTEPPVPTFYIPEGFRATTINVDSRSGVEGFARPDSRVDVLWTYQDKLGMKIKTLVRFAKVLSIGGQTKSNNSNAPLPSGDLTTTATLLVKETEAKEIELARSTGKLSLSLVGDFESIDTTERESMAISFNEISRDETLNEGKPYRREGFQGELSMFDPNKGENVTFKLRENRWEPKPREFFEKKSNLVRRASFNPLKSWVKRKSTATLRD